MKNITNYRKIVFWKIIIMNKKGWGLFTKCLFTFPSFFTCGGIYMNFLMVILILGPICFFVRGI